jgi:isoleucyl-tRNA synthetase
MAINYKDTLNLPKTDFPMKANLVQREPEMLARWEKEDVYAQIQKARKSSGKKFVLHDGPPFANGDVHIGTALNKILKDFIVKSKSMAGFYAPYVPGWDCHGLPIEFKVVKDSSNLAPAQVRKKSEEFAMKYIDIQRKQFKRLGVLGDWDHPYLTLDKKYEAEEIRGIADVVRQGLVYRGKKPVYWSTGCQTALAEAEVEYADKESPAIYVKYEVVDMSPKTYVVIWTTTPWTLPASLAVAIHPKLPYGFYQWNQDRIIVADSLPSKVYEQLGLKKLPDAPIGNADFLKLKLKHPFLDRVVPVLAADYVASDTGTGCVHTAPGHGQDDYNLAKHLGLLSPVDDQGKFTAECGVPEWVGKYVFAANKDVVELLQKKGALVFEEKIQHSYPHCWRSKTPIIFRSVEQWFISIEKLRKAGMDAINTVQFYPAWGQNRIRGTLESRGDWCISRQRSWGVPIPIFYKADGEPILDPELILKFADLVEKHGSNIWFEKSADELAKELGLPSGLSKRNDTLDVWIDSGSSHRSVLLKHPELQFPADVYLEGSDQHRGWFQSSLLMSVAVNGGKAPYKALITHGFLVDLDGKKISKSGSYEKPKDAEAFVNKYGADMLRLWVASENYQNDIPLSEEIFTRISETYRSVRNTFRILLGNLHDFDPQRDSFDWNGSNGNHPDVLLDRWMLSKLQNLVKEVQSGYDTYEFHKVYHAVNAFCAVEISSLYVDITKDRMYCDEANSFRRRATQTVMYEIVSALARMMAPILSFTSEEAWGFLMKDGSSVHLQLMPVEKSACANKELEEAFGRLLQYRVKVAAELEQARKAGKLGKSIEARIVLSVEEKEFAFLTKFEGMLPEFFIVSQIELKQAQSLAIEVVQPRGKKCARSWRWDETVGSDPEFPDLSSRDAAAVRASANAASATS